MAATGRLSVKSCDELLITQHELLLNLQ
jgi:hypothetical protein